jgi:DHA1 family tetracycline resistance protein-like MFS transporter
MGRARLSTIFAIVFVDLLGFSLILPLVPFYAKEFSASDTVVGLLVASYAAAQLIGAPILGRLSDRYGRRPVLLTSILGTAVGFLILGMASSLTVLFAARILDGLTGGNISVAQAYITDITEERDRARGLGLVGAAFGLGFIIGPAAGGLLSNVGESISLRPLGLNIVWQFALPAFAAAAIATINIAAVYFFLPESLTEAQREKLSGQPGANFSLASLREAFSRPLVGPLLYARFFFSLAFSLFQTIFPLFALRRLGLQADETAFVLAYVGLLVAVVQGVVVGRLAERFSESRLLLWALILISLSFLAWGFTPNLIVLLIVLAPLALAGGILNTVFNSVLTKAVHPDEVGGTLGLSASLDSLSRVISPAGGGFLLDVLGTWAPGLLSAVISALVTGYAYLRILRDTGMNLSGELQSPRAP